MVNLRFKNYQKTWEGLNEFLLKNEKDINTNKWGYSHSNELFLYNLLLEIESPYINPEFDFGYIMGYTNRKWRSLINNYVDFNYLELIKSEIAFKYKKKNPRNYNYAYHFANHHGSGKDCLISLNFIKRLGEQKPILLFTLRASEVTKRLMIDLALLQKLGQFVFGNIEYTTQIFLPVAFLTVENSIMYDNHNSITKLLKEQKDNLGPFQKRVLKRLKYFKKVDPKTIKYKVHLRTVRQLQKDESGKPISGRPPFLVKDLKL